MQGKLRLLLAWKDLTAEQASRLISQYYTTLSKNISKTDKERLPSYMEFLKMGKSSNLLKDIGMSPKEIKKGLNVEMPRWAMTYNYDVKVNVYGGGSTGQAEAVRMALARVMCEVGEGNRAILKPEGLLTRDPRMVERKKFGQKKARKRLQFSKR